MKINALAHSVLIAGGTVALGVLWHFSRIPGSSGQLALFAALAALFFSSLAMAPVGRKVIALGSIGVVATVYSAELALAIGILGPATNRPFWNIDRFPSQTKKALAAELRITIDPRDRVELIDDLRHHGSDAVPATMLADILERAGTSRSPESIDASEVAPVGGISSTLTVLCNETQFVTYHSDEHGFRNPRGIWDSTRADIAAVGESLTQGYCVPDGKGFVDLLRAEDRIVLNLGASGQSGMLQLAAIKEYLPQYAPRIVLWVFCEGIDLSDLYTESANPLLMRYLEPAFSQRLIERQPEIDKTLRRVLTDIEKRERQSKLASRRRSLVETSLGIVKLWQVRERVHSAYGGSDGDPRLWSMLEKSSHNLLADAIVQAQSVVKAWGGNLYFVYLPSWDRYRNDPSGPEREHREVLKLVNALEIPVIDVQAEFQRHSDPLSLFPYRRFGHYNEEGNRVVGETVLRSLSGEWRRDSAVYR